MTQDASCDLYSFEKLPALLPVFPLARVVLLPGISLPLNIFEPRYLAMVDHAMQGDRLIGMIQPRPREDDHKLCSLYKTGCAGRITSYEETDDGRYLITLKGVCRFDVGAEEPLHSRGFRVVRPDWQGYRADVTAVDDSHVCRQALLDMLRPYLTKMDMSCDQWDSMKQVSCDRLVSTLTMICPFTAEEKQMLLEAPSLDDRMKALRVFLESALMETTTGVLDADMPHRCH